ncbi:MAG: hypothetical protein NTW59_03805, partial [Candidatus Diapherotrites archaeon]|nr:hypothetical protein [Candidatus Diapherotrites archaeon]
MGHSLRRRFFFSFWQPTFFFLFFKRKKKAGAGFINGERLYIAKKQFINWNKVRFFIGFQHGFGIAQGSLFEGRGQVV